MNNTIFGENTLYVQRMFSYYPANTKQFTENQQVAGGGKKTFWQRHKGKILGAAALAGAGALGYKFRNEIQYGLSSHDGTSLSLASPLLTSPDLNDIYNGLCQTEEKYKTYYYSFKRNSDFSDDYLTKRYKFRKAVPEMTRTLRAIVTRNIEAHASQSDEAQLYKKAKSKLEEFCSWLSEVATENDSILETISRRNLSWEQKERDKRIEESRVENRNAYYGTPKYNFRYD